MSLPYKHVLVIGATSGIGAALADKFVEAGSTVTAVGRRTDRLAEFVSKHGAAKAKSVTFDLASRDQIPQFVAEVTKSSPDIDCVFLNAGASGRYDFSKPESVDIEKFNNELNVNLLSFVALTHAFIPFLKEKKSETRIIFTTSNISIVPAVIFPAYSASKAGLNAFIFCLREQLSETSIKIIELSPPAVQTELHDNHMGKEAGRKFGMPVEEFTKLAFEGLVDGNDTIYVGSIGPQDEFDEIVRSRRVAFEGLAKMMKNF